jgi:hypothetical protein
VRSKLGGGFICDLDVLARIGEAEVQAAAVQQRVTTSRHAEELRKRITQVRRVSSSLTFPVDQNQLRAAMGTSSALGHVRGGPS